MLSPCFSTGVGSSTAPGYRGNLTLLASVQLSSSSALLEGFCNCPAQRQRLLGLLAGSVHPRPGRCRVSSECEQHGTSAVRNPQLSVLGPVVSLSQP